MERPSWVTVIGILGLIFGCTGLLGGGNDIMMPTMLKFQKKIFHQFGTVFQEAGEDYLAEETDKTVPRVQPRTTKPDFPVEVFKMVESMWQFPDWFPAWSVTSGIIKIIISAFYLVAAILLLQLKPASINLFYGAVGLSILIGLIKAIVAAIALSFLGMTLMAGGAFGIIIDTVLIVVVFTSDKAAFKPVSLPPLPH